MAPDSPKLTLTDDLTKIDFTFVHGWLSKSYWSEGIAISRMKRAMEHSINVGAFLDGRQVGYSRIITDHATFAYLCDVFVDESARGLGASKEMMRFILGLPALQGIKRFTLVTKDAHGLYRQFGWEDLKQPDMYLEIARPGIYKTLNEV
jgi:GNAT superfamily N-acetyltransferase